MKETPEDVFEFIKEQVTQVWDSLNILDLSENIFTEE